jgi:colicin import membrane protein
MTRLHKKCLIASTGMHAFLVLLVVFGSAFFLAKERPVTQQRLQFVPSKWIEASLAGGGGNPNIARTDDVQKGNPNVPTPRTPPVVQPQTVRQPEPPPPTPPPKPEPKHTEVKPEPPKVEPVKQPKTPVKPADPKVTDKELDKTPPKRAIDISELRPIKTDDSAKVKAKAEAEAREARAREIAANRRKMANQLNNAATQLQRGFEDGTKVDVGGPGGEAFANYSSFVQAAYSSAWQIIQDLSDDDAIALVKVTIARDGRVLSSQITRRSGNATMDNSVQRALDRVRDRGLPPFPDFIKERERSFTIEFNLKTRKLMG